MKVAIIDKHPITRSGIKNVLQNRAGITNPLEGSCMISFYEKFKDENPELIIVSIGQQKGITNLQILGFIKRFYPHSSIIVYDDQIVAEMVPKYFQLGIVGYLSKQDELLELESCIEKLKKGEPYIGCDLLYLLMRNEAAMERVYHVKSENSLTKRESEIAGYLIKGQRTTEIAKMLNRKVSTISTIKMNIFKKMKVDNIISLGQKLS
ncbi:response regulator transcription factor [Dyadobacter tibetensis]|uniref:response regulator transcription factor n=1 Tax=Dyadobacter tibetensis TaxID=1211851 RepID=UPI0004AE63A5|nr:response regulator transcription factor [Dyadobacter tibetensis]